MSTANILGYWIITPVIAKRKSKCKESLCVDFAEQGIIRPGETCMQFTNAYGAGKFSRTFRCCLKCAETVIVHHMAPYEKALEALELKLVEEAG